MSRWLRAACIGLGLAVLTPCASATAPIARTYYENGKPIPAPKQVPPVYPPKEHQRRIGGTVEVAFDFDRDGKVTAASVKASSGNRNLDAAALASVKQSRFDPPLKDGAPQPGSSTTTITFTP